MKRALLLQEHTNGRFLLRGVSSTCPVRTQIQMLTMRMIMKMTIEMKMKQEPAMPVTRINFTSKFDGAFRRCEG